MSITLKFYRKLLLIKLNLWQRLFRLWIAGKLVRLGFWISPDLKKGIYKAVRR